MNKELIELISDTVSKGNEVDVLTIYVVCEAQGFVRGTYTSYISMMKKAGYLRRVKHGVYAIGRPASAQTIALNLQRLILHKKGVLPRNAPVENEQVERKKPSESLFKKPYTPFKTEPEELKPLKPAHERMMDAIRVLKSFDLKVTIEF